MTRENFALKIKKALAIVGILSIGCFVLGKWLTVLSVVGITYLYMFQVELYQKHIRGTYELILDKSYDLFKKKFD